MKTAAKFLMSGIFAGLAVFAGGCASKPGPEPLDPNLRLTPGSVKMQIREGVSTQQQVFEAVGVPNVVFMQSGKGEVWTYDQIKVRRTAHGYGAGAQFATIFPYGGSDKKAIQNGGGGAGVSASGSMETATTSVQTATLIVRFNLKGKVESYSMLVTSF